MTELNQDIQEALLHFLETQNFKRKNGKSWIHASVRTMVSTNKNLRQEVQQGRFNKKLFEHLNVLSFNIPPLRERASDIPLLIDQFNEEFGKDFCLPINPLSQDKIQPFLKSSWPGNVRELRNKVERAFILASSQKEKQTFSLDEKRLDFEEERLL